MTLARQREAIRRADAVANAAEQAVHQWWAELLALIRRAPELGYIRLQQAAQIHFRRLPVVTRATLAKGLIGVYRWGVESARRGVLREVPRKRLERVAMKRMRALPGRAIASVTEEQQAIPDDLLLSLILPAPPEHVIHRRVERLIAPFLATPRPDLVDPQLHASQLVQSYAEGKTLQEIAKDLLPIAEGVRASARRVARTWGIALAQDAQFEAHESLGPGLVIGYEIHATPGPYSRPWHEERSGTIYYREPGSGQKGFSQMPRPPREAPDASERPLGTPWIAWN